MEVAFWDLQGVTWRGDRAQWEDTEERDKSSSKWKSSGGKFLREDDPGAVS